jgi:acetylornithine deacetylase/succinyl-diaminopimelate desuccinylase-like protein
VALIGETIELLQALIRNGCVNDGTPDPASGGELRNSDLLESYLGTAGVDVEHFEAHAGRRSLVARIEGSDPSAPTLCLMGHTDVVPVSPDGWREDPFGGELIDGEVWGRGAIDMLNITASQAVAFRTLAERGFRPKGTLIYFGVADEEAGGALGAQWMVDHHWDAIGCDYVLTEMGGWSYGGRKVSVTVAEKGLAWRRLRVRGTPGHASMPYRTDNALVLAAEVVRRLDAYRPKSGLDELWGARVEASGLPEHVQAGLIDPARLEDTLAALPDGMARLLHACTHTTFSPTVAHGGVKTNVIPDQVDIDVDIRTLPGVKGDDVDASLAEALGDLADRVEVSRIFDSEASASPAGTPLWHVLERCTRDAYPDADLLPELIVGATDSRFFRDKGTVAYGAGLFSPEVSMADFASRFHGHNERIDVGSLELTVNLWLRVAEEFLA